MNEKKTIAIALEDKVLRKIKVICARKEWSLGQFYEAAINNCIKKIEIARVNNTGIQLREMPNNLRRSSIWMRARPPEEMFEKSPGVFKRVLLYTAVHDYLDENFNMETCI